MCGKSRRNAGGQASASSTLKPTLRVWQLRRTAFSVGRPFSRFSAILRWTFIKLTKKTKTFPTQALWLCKIHLW